MKHEWRKKEKSIYLPKAKPEIQTFPAYNYLSIAGKGNPNSKSFGDYISALYSVSYAIKMTLKKRVGIDNYNDWTVYPLEGWWDISDEAKRTFNGVINKDDLDFNLMIRQPDFVSIEFVDEMISFTKNKKPQVLLDSLKFDSISDGKCVQMMHVGSYDDEAASFATMEEFTIEKQLRRLSKDHREIYISDFRKVEASKLKTVLRFKVEEI